MNPARHAIALGLRRGWTERFTTPGDVEVDGRLRTVTRVSLSADDPGAAVALLRTRVPSTDR